MTTAEKLIAIAENVPKVYEAGKAAGGGVVAVEEKDVNFYDYDGTCLYAYTIAEAQALTELPPLPSHDGLVCQGWNWSLESIRVGDYRRKSIGATYITADGKTRLYINLISSDVLTIPLYINQSADSGVTINWGDGSAKETISGTGYVSTEHTYPDVGEYVIELEVTLGTMSFGTGTSTTGCLGSSRRTKQTLTRLEIGNKVPLIGADAFNESFFLKKIVIPDSVTSLGNGAFNGCVSLFAIVFPMHCNLSVTYLLYGAQSLQICLFGEESSGTLSTYCFRYAVSLKVLQLPKNLVGIIGTGAFEQNFCIRQMEMPNTVTGITTNAFLSCSGLLYVFLGENLTTISNGAFNGCTSVIYYDFSHCIAVPTLANTNAFTGIPTDCEIRVPSALYDEWVVATNWATYADHIVGV